MSSSSLMMELVYTSPPSLMSTNETIDNKETKEEMVSLLRIQPDLQNHEQEQQVQQQEQQEQQEQQDEQQQIDQKVVQNNSKRQQMTLNSIPVVAPCNMDAGFTFMAPISTISSQYNNNRNACDPLVQMSSSSSSISNNNSPSNRNDTDDWNQCWVTVPSGGVQKGQVFWVKPNASSCLSSVPSQESTTTTPFFFDNDFRRNSYQNGPVGIGRSSSTGKLLMANINNRHGGWKDGLFDCFRFGLCHPTLWNSLCCPQILMGQVLTRLNMTWLGDECTPSNSIGMTTDVYSNSKTSLSSKTTGSRWWTRQTTFSKISLIVIVYWALTVLLSPPQIPDMSDTIILVPDGIQQNSKSNTSSDMQGAPFLASEPVIVQKQDSTWNSIRHFLYNATSWILGLYTLVVLTKLRQSIRRRYSIGPTYLTTTYANSSDAEGLAEDCCISFWCGCCSVAQMARQTCDYEQDDVYASCCTPTGFVRHNASGTFLSDSRHPVCHDSTTTTTTSTIIRSFSRRLSGQNSRQQPQEVVVLTV